MLWEQDESQVPEVPAGARARCTANAGPGRCTCARLSWAAARGFTKLLPGLPNLCIDTPLQPRGINAPSPLTSKSRIAATPSLRMLGLQVGASLSYYPHL